MGIGKSFLEFLTQAVEDGGVADDVERCGAKRPACGGHAGGNDKLCFVTKTKSLLLRRW